MSKKLTMKDIELAFFYGKEYVALIIEMPGFSKPEAIINSKFNFAEKLGYVKSVYTDDLQHKHSAGVKIIGAVAANSLEELGAGLANGFKI